MSLQAMAGDTHDRGVGLYLDQDLFAFGLNEDRDYTTGVAMEFFWQKQGLYPMDEGVLWLGQRLGVLDEKTTTERSFTIGSMAYTPNDLSASESIFDDRPYASLIYLGNKHVYADHDSAIGVELRVGVLGTGVAREAQQAMHRLWRDAANDSEPVDPKGWGHQISNGGEATLGLRVAYSKLLAESRYWDVSSVSSVNLGYQTNASFGLEARAGHIASPSWTLPYSPINRGNFLPSLAGEEWYVWVAGQVRLVGYDVLLQGQFRDSDVEVDSGDIKRIVYDAGVGLTLTNKPVQVTFAINGKTSELNSSASNRNHVWGGIYVMFPY